MQQRRVVSSHCSAHATSACVTSGQSCSQLLTTIALTAGELERDAVEGVVVACPELPARVVREADVLHTPSAAENLTSRACSHRS